MKNKNRKELLSFIEYCLEHPEERFWQAIRNWSQYSFIFAWKPDNLGMQDDGNFKSDGLEEITKMGLEDTFYWE